MPQRGSANCSQQQQQQQQQWMRWGQGETGVGVKRYAAIGCWVSGASSRVGVLADVTAVLGERLPLIRPASAGSSPSRVSMEFLEVVLVLSHPHLRPTSVPGQLTDSSPPPPPPRFTRLCPFLRRSIGRAACWMIRVVQKWYILLFFLLFLFYCFKIVNIDEAKSVSDCPLIATHISNPNEAITATFDTTMTALGTRMHHVLSVSTLTFVKGHTDLNH